MGVEDEDDDDEEDEDEDGVESASWLAERWGGEKAGSAKGKLLKRL